MSILASILFGKGANIIRNTEGDETLNLIGIPNEEWVMAPLVFKYCLELLEMKLIIDGTVIARLESAKELLALKAIHHVDVALVILCVSVPQELLDCFLEVIVANFMKVVGSIALRLVVAVIP